MEISLRVILIIFAFILAVLIVVFFSLQLFGFQPISLLGGEKVGELKSASSVVSESLLNFKTEDYSYLDTSGMIVFPGEYPVDASKYFSLYPIEMKKWEITECAKCDRMSNDPSNFYYNYYICNFIYVQGDLLCGASVNDPSNYYFLCKYDSKEGSGDYPLYHNLTCFYEDTSQQPELCKKLETCMKKLAAGIDSTCVVDEILDMGYYYVDGHVINQGLDIVNNIRNTIKKCKISLTQKLNEDIEQKICNFENRNFIIDNNIDPSDFFSFSKSVFYPICGKGGFGELDYIYYYYPYGTHRSLIRDEKIPAKLKLVMGNFRPRNCNFTLFLCSQVPFAEDEDDSTMKIYEFFRDWNPTMLYKNITCNNFQSPYSSLNFLYNTYRIELDDAYSPEDIVNSIETGLYAWTFINGENFNGTIPWNYTFCTFCGFTWKEENINPMNLNICDWTDRRWNKISIDCSRGRNKNMCDGTLSISVFISGWNSWTNLEPVFNVYVWDDK
ncbi:MAG: hypothetical protein QXF15_01595 [Candidatus Aenigmatarchaeota archaeon]